LIPTDYFLYFIDGDTVHALTMLNNDISINMRFFISLSITQVYFKFCYMDVSSFNYHYINYAVDTTGCNGTSPGYMTLE
jgi:hypothetical protein